MEKNIVSIKKHFASLEDPRILLKTSHRLIDVIVIAICAAICGAETWTQVEEFGKAKLEWFKTFLELPHDVPSHDTFGRLFSLISAKHFQACFQEWIKAVFEVTAGQVIAIDGKTARRSHNKRANKSAIHMVHAWAAANSLLLGQVKTSEKSNEITAIPELLQLLEIKGCIITIDAMGCQREIAKEVSGREADYVLTVKGNQEKLESAIQQTFQEAKANNFTGMNCSQHETTDKNHGRTEIRACYVLPVIYLMGSKNFKKLWRGLKSIVLIESTRIGLDKTTVEQRYYISSLKPNAKKISAAIRQHWSVENSLHWSLDVTFKEDQCRVRMGESAENFSLLKKIALMFLKKETSLKGGIQTKRLRAGWDMKYLSKVLAL